MYWLSGMSYVGVSSPLSSSPESAVSPVTFRLLSTVITTSFDNFDAGFLYVIAPGNLSSSSPNASPIIASFSFVLL